MVGSKLLKRIQEAVPKLTPKERAVAQYIVDHYKTAAFLTSVELGEAAGVSDTTVIRLASSLGYDGFTGLKKDLQYVVKNKLSAKEKFSSTISSLNEENYIRTVYEHERQNLEVTLDLVAPEDVHRVVEMVARARKTFIMGLGISAAPVRFLTYRLRRIQKDVVELNASAYSLVEKISTMSEADILVLFDFPRYSIDAFKTIRHARKEIGAGTVLVTDSLNNKAQTFADVTLMVRNESMGFTNSILGSDFIANLISVGVALKEKDKSYAQLERNEKFSRVLKHST